MPRYKRMRGGLFGWDTAKNWYGNVSGKAKDYWNSVSGNQSSYTSPTATSYDPQTTNSYTSPTTNSYTSPTTNSYTSPTTNSYATPGATSYGGRRSRTRKMRGGYSDYTPLTGLAYSASPISDIRTAEQNNWVGGRTKRRRGRRSRK